MTDTKGFDLAAIDTVAACNKPFELEIIHPVTGNGLGVFISIVGKDSDVYRKRIKALADESITRNARGKGMKLVDKIEEDNIAALVAVTTGWRNVVLDGKALEFNPGNARTLYTRILPIREQVQEAVNNIENFMPG
jgi:hypothetical protein